VPAPAPAPVPVAGVLAADPEGDGSEGGSTAPVTDGDPATAWSSERYDSAVFGGLKGGVGLVLDLGADVDVTSVELTGGGEGGAVELRSTPGGPDPLAGSTVLAQSPAGGAQVLAPPAPARTRQLLLWFTRAATVDGEFRVAVGDVRVLGTPAAP
ncbi:serine/threonine protein kinase, partial [Kineococcus sp. T90]